MPKTEGSQQIQTPKIEEKKTDTSQAERDIYMKTARQDIDQLRNKIDALAVTAKNSSANLRLKLETRIQGFQEELRVIEKKWQDLKGVSETAWKDTKNSLSESIESLRKALQMEPS